MRLERFLLFLLFQTIASQGGGDDVAGFDDDAGFVGGGVVVGGEGGDSGDSCSSCCSPGDPSSSLVVVYGLPFILGSIMLLLLITFCGYQWIKSLLFFKLLRKMYPYKESFPDNGVYNGHYFQYGTYFYMNNITLTFHDDIIQGSGTDEVGSYNWNGKMYNDRPIRLEKTYQINTGNYSENFGHTVVIDLIPARIQQSLFPALIGKFYVARNNTQGMWFIIPEEIEYNVDEIFPAGRSKKKISLFICILVITLFMVIHYDVSIPNFYNTIYSDHVIGVPWGGFFSLIGCLFLIFVEDVFKLGKMRAIQFRIDLFIGCIFCDSGFEHDFCID